MSFSTLNHQPLAIAGPVTPTVDLTKYTSAFTEPESDSKSRCWKAALRDGLPTPPNDMNGIVYNAIPSIVHGGPARGLPPNHVYNPLRPSHDAGLTSSKARVNPQYASTRAYLPIAKAASATEPVGEKRPSVTGTNFALRIPSTINNSKGNLAEFAAQMTCLFWFEQTAKLKDIEQRRPTSPNLVPEAVPTIGFQKWVASILSTTQVSQNVILLALLFIYRLKKFNSGVKGKKGSEFRLMTVALMLGNKFLDDNTYTNKTWAEVSGIAVQEIHIMEVEFLSNIRYDLLTSEAQWSEWHAKLGLFAAYFDSASKVSAAGRENTMDMRISPPRLHAPLPSSKLPSPPLDHYRPQSQPQPRIMTPLSGLPYTGYLPPSEGAASASSKRSYDGSDDLHPAKRIAHSSAHLSSSALPTPSVVSTLPPVLTPTSVPTAHTFASAHMGRLPMLSLPPGSNPLSHALPMAPISQLPAPTLMYAAYPPASSWAQQTTATPMPTSVAPPVYSVPPVSDMSRHPQSSFGASSAAVSPAGSAYSIPTPQKHLSPSYFLANRNSPYRPVRSVHTLLIPPPTASMMHQRSIPFDHMHYQPLGKSQADRKTGQLPYIYPEGWNQPQYQPPFPPSQFSG
ncbi:Uncharacterized protein PECH_006661 [Penicillium ucsense]|uniref:Cyclin n=1 Tax=Penicillium ucsense TaxID=2839758 RepID=A0A8J8VWG1_9EURO|nr:Uncharacterized protein PECM_002293 [Penicillium ucsense]KAF7735456.1 Uncharacterized protein PECH_006661 [Penicillium ucsense]